MELRNSVALLTGASRGIGPHIARELAQEGASVALVARSLPGLEVAAAVVDAIVRDLPEVIVNSMPVRPLLALNALSPRLGLWLLEIMGITAFQRRKVGVATAARTGVRNP